MQGSEGSHFPPLLKFGAFTPEDEARLKETFTLVDESAIERDPRLAQQVKGLVTRSNYRVTKALIDQLPALKIIATNGVGFDGIPVDYAAQKGIVVTHTPDVLNKAVAELAIGLLFSLLRRLPAADRFVREGQWLHLTPALAYDLAGKKVGIVGLGRIGKEIANRLEAFEVDIAYFGRKPQAVAWSYFSSVEALAASVDILIVTCPGGADTFHLIDESVLGRLGPEGFIVNIARGSVIDEAALCRALSERAIRGAALDVFEHEPLADSPLLGLDNVVLTPHIGSATHETRRRMTELVIRNLVSFFTTGRAVTPVPSSFQMN